MATGVAWIWVGDEMERIFEKHKSGLCGRWSREPSHGNWEARGLAGLGAYVTNFSPPDINYVGHVSLIAESSDIQN